MAISSQVGLHVSRAHNSAFYSGIMTCGSVWSCPVCTAKVQERRRAEIQKGIDWIYAEGLQPVMVTFTFPHYSWHMLRELVKQQADALQKLRAGAPWTRFKLRVGYVGLIRSLELTYGANGWHPHTHEVWAVSRNVKAEDMQKLILKRWKSSCARAGLLDLKNAEQVAAFEAHAVDVKGWVTASDYLAKQDDSRHWGVDQELAKSSTKQGRAKGLHPFGLLRKAVDGDKKAAGLFLDYVSAMKGKRQIFWSNGFKAMTGVDEKTDEELAEEEMDIADVLGVLEIEEWDVIRRHGKIAQVLDALELGGMQAVLDLLKSLTGKPAPKLGPMVDRFAVEAGGDGVAVGSNGGKLGIECAHAHAQGVSVGTDGGKLGSQTPDIKSRGRGSGKRSVKLGLNGDQGSFEF